MDATNCKDVSIVADADTFTENTIFGPFDIIPNLRIIFTLWLTPRLCVYKIYSTCSVCLEIVILGSKIQSVSLIWCVVKQSILLNTYTYLANFCKHIFRFPRACEHTCIDLVFSRILGSGICRRSDCFLLIAWGKCSSCKYFNIFHFLEILLVSKLVISLLRTYFESSIVR